MESVRAGGAEFSALVYDQASELSSRAVIWRQNRGRKRSLTFATENVPLAAIYRIGQVISIGQAKRSSHAGSLRPFPPSAGAEQRVALSDGIRNGTR
jgi:hypothetical protein